MRVLADSAFPKSIESFSTLEEQIVRPVAPFHSDSFLIDVAVEASCQAVALLGLAALSNPNFLAAAKEKRVAIIAVADLDPITAAQTLSQNLSRIRTDLTPDDPTVLHLTTWRKLSDFAQDEVRGK